MTTTTQVLFLTTCLAFSKFSRNAWINSIILSTRCFTSNNWHRVWTCKRILSVPKYLCSHLRFVNETELQLLISHLLILFSFVTLIMASWSRRNVGRLYRFFLLAYLKWTDKLQIVLVAKKYLCCNCSSVGCLKCVQFHNWFRLH